MEVLIEEDRQKVAMKERERKKESEKEQETKVEQLAKGSGSTVLSEANAQASVWEHHTHLALAKEGVNHSPEDESAVRNGQEKESENV